MALKPMVQLTCIHLDCDGAPIDDEHPLCVIHAWATIAAIAEALTKGIDKTPDKSE